MEIKIGQFTLTTEHSASSHGIPVLVFEGEAYGQGDILPDGTPVIEAISEEIAYGGYTQEEIFEILQWQQAFQRSPGRTPMYGRKKKRVSFSISEDAHNALIADANFTGDSKNETLEKILREKYNIT